MEIVDFVIVASLMFAILTCYHIIIHSRRKDETSKEEYALVKAILTEFKHRADEQNKKISELMVKIDLLESRIGTPEKKEHVKESITQEKIKNIAEEKANIGLSDIELNILKFIATGPKSSREVQLTIRKSREHTARLLKNLYLKKLLNRENQGRFFVYSLSDQGKKIIAEL